MQFRISLAQINPKAGDLEGNLRKILAGIERARKEECDLVVFPEMAISGYCLDEKLLMNRRFLRENRRVLLEEILPACGPMALITGFVDFEEEAEAAVGTAERIVRYNAAAVIQDGQLLQTVHKRLLPAYRYFDDKRYFTPGRETIPVRIRCSQGSVSVGVLICEDLWDEEYEFKPCAGYREQGAQYLVSINSSPFVGSHPDRRDGKRFERERWIREQVRRYGLPILYLNTVGVGDNGKNVIPFDGLSQAYDSRGELVSSLRQFEEDQQTVVFESGQAEPVQEPPFDRDEEIFQALVMSVRDYYEKVGTFQGVLQPVSGGVDSALGAVLAAEAVGKERLTLYNLPSRYNTPGTRELARRLSENLDLDYHVVPIQDILDRIVADFETHLRPIRSQLTLENLQARIRGVLMMAESNDRNALLLTNGNETEIALGYSTLYGDMAGGLSLIGDLNKPDVYRLGRHANRRSGREVIPEGIFTQAPSAELSEGQVDPFDYEVVGPLVSALMEGGTDPDQLVEQFRSRSLDRIESGAVSSVYGRYNAEEFRELVEDLFRRLNRSVYKRLQGAPIVVVSRRAFGFDLRETIINGWTG